MTAALGKPATVNSIISIAAGAAAIIAPGSAAVTGLIFKLTAGAAEAGNTAGHHIGQSAKRQRCCGQHMEFYLRNQ
jgi:hypothetical protein